MIRLIPIYLKIEEDILLNRQDQDSVNDLSGGSNNNNRDGIDSYRSESTGASTPKQSKQNEFLDNNDGK